MQISKTVNNIIKYINLSELFLRINRILINNNTLTIIALILIPIIFVTITYSAIYFTMAQRIQPYIRIASLFVNSGGTHKTQETHDLLALYAVIPMPTPIEIWDENSSSNVLLIPRSEIIIPGIGDLYGRLTIDNTKIDAQIFWGDSIRELNRGIGTFSGSWLPGFGRTIIMTGHRGTYLADLYNAQIGGFITVETHYGVYVYEITEIAIKQKNDETAYDLRREDENIIIYTMYPFDSVEHTINRFFVYGKLVSGVQVDK